MILQDGILDALADDDESIIQIEKYLKYLKIKADRDEIIIELSHNLKEGLIAINYPPKVTGQNKLNSANIEDYWFGLTNKGQNKWERVKDKL